jgi:hypothetical protein
VIINKASQYLLATSDPKIPAGLGAPDESKHPK